VVAIVPTVFVMRNLVPNHQKNKSFVTPPLHAIINGVGDFYMDFFYVVLC
jgi:hypothetical protein